MTCIGVSRVINPAQAINVIGGTWMGCSQKSRDQYGNEYTQNSRTVNGWWNSSSYFEKWTQSGWNACPTSYTSIQVTETTHDFNHTGSPQWRPYTDYFSYK